MKGKKKKVWDGINPFYIDIVHTQTHAARTYTRTPRFRFHLI